MTEKQEGGDLDGSLALPGPGTALKAYMGFDRQVGSEEGACLIFAHDAREAKVTGFPILSGWGTEWLDVAVRRLPDWGYEQANPDKLAAGIPHAIETPEGCPGCEIWGHEIMESGYCESCDLEREGDSQDGAAVAVAASAEASNPIPPSTPTERK